MGKTISLTAADGHTLSAYEAEPQGAFKGGLVILQEIFGVTGHIRRVCDGYAADGFRVAAPALFDRARRDVELDYGDIEGGKSLVQAINPGDVLKDVAAAVEHLSAFGPVAVVGFCWGGTLAHAAAGGLPIKASVSYYGGHIVNLLERTPKVPVQYHFGEQDAHIPAEAVAQIRAAFPEQEIHTYPSAGHGFNCDERPDYHAPSAALARKRALAFLEKHLVGA